MASVPGVVLVHDVPTGFGDLHQHDADSHDCERYYVDPRTA